MTLLRTASILLATLLAVSPAFAQGAEEEEEIQDTPNPADLGELGFFPGGGLFHDVILHDFAASTGELSYEPPGGTEAGPQPEPPTGPIARLEAVQLEAIEITAEALDPCESCDDAGPQLIRRIDPDYVFAGVEKVKVAGGGRAIDSAMLVLELSDLGLFVGQDETDRRYVGTWLATGKSGRKFELFLADMAKPLFAEKISEQVGALVGAPSDVEFSRMRLKVKLDRNGENPTLKIKGRGVVQGTAAPVRYKATLRGSVAPDLGGELVL